jgi:hypothetical protein
MNKPKFRPAPKSQAEKEKLENDFINAADSVKTVTNEQEKTKSFLIRLPESVWKDLKTLSFTQEKSMSSICGEAIRKKIKKDLNK